MIGKTGTARILLRPEINSTLDEWAENDIATKRAIIRVVALENLDFKSIDYYAYTKKKREEKIKRVEFWMQWSPIAAQQIIDAAAKSRTFFTEWLEELLSVKTKEWKEAKNVVKSSNRQSTKP
jgi:hypothetical protein